MAIEPYETAKTESFGTLNLKIECSTEQVYKTLVNLLGVIQWNCGVGHSAISAAFFDGDGADKLRIEGLPEGDYEAMAQALSSYGDGLMGCVGADVATAYNENYLGNGQSVYRTKQVWPEKPDS